MARPFLALILFVCSAFSQQDAPSLRLTEKSSESTELTFARFARSSKEFLRDSAELPMHMAFSLSATNAAGKVVKTRHGAVDYDFHGYNSRSREGNFTIHGWKARNKGVGTLAGAPVIVSLLMLPEAEQAFRMRVIDSPDPEIVIAEFSLISECQPVWNNEFDVPTQTCGNFKVQLHKNDLSMKSLTFAIVGMPLQGEVDYLGQAAINHEYISMDFQKVTLAADPRPFVVPSHITCTLETDRGKLVINGEFTVKKIKQK
jgi:hypothetical protein